MTQKPDITDFTKITNLDKFRFNLQSESQKLFHLISKKEPTKDASLSDFAVDKSINNLSERIDETNENVKHLYQSMNALLTQQNDLHKQLIDQIAKNSSMLERVLLINQSVLQPSLDTPISQLAVSQEPHPMNNTPDGHRDSIMAKRKSRLTFRQESRDIIKKEKIEKESDLFEDFLI